MASALVVTSAAFAEAHAGNQGNRADIQGLVKVAAIVLCEQFCQLSWRAGATFFQFGVRRGFRDGPDRRWPPVGELRRGNLARGNRAHVGHFLCAQRGGQAVVIACDQHQVWRLGVEPTDSGFGALRLAAQKTQRRSDRHAQTPDTLLVVHNHHANF